MSRCKNPERYDEDYVFNEFRVAVLSPFYCMRIPTLNNSKVNNKIDLSTSLIT